jgi:HprK-related kinase A
MRSAKLGRFSESDIEQCLRREGLSFEVGLFRCLVRSNTGQLSKPIRLLYQDFPADLTPSGFYDFRINLNQRRHLFSKDWKVTFDWEGNSPFPSLPLAHAAPLFEWGLNWCVATASGSSTVIHSAVVEREGRALILPGQPGSGKSTLCAALALGDWRLLSDELTIISQSDGRVQPVPRPISLKGKSIDIIRTTYPLADMTPPVSDTHKGAIAYARPATSAVAASKDTVPVGYVVFPTFKAGSSFIVERLSRAMALSELLDNTFNVGLLGAQGFKALARAISDAECYAVEYGDLDSILNWVNTTCRKS